MEGFKHYISTDERVRITDGWSAGIFPDRDTAGAILLREDGGYQFRFFTEGVENPALREDHGVPLFAYKEQTIVARAAEEVDADIAALPPVPPFVEERLQDALAALSLLGIEEEETEEGETDA